MRQLDNFMFLQLVTVTSSLPISLAENSDKNNTAFTSELLSATVSTCNNKTGLSCLTSNFDRDNRIMFCSFSCPRGTEYRCKKPTDHGIVEFCAKSEICDKGQMNKVYFDEEHQKVVIQKTSCPVGFFQPVEENCYSACTEYRHIEESLLPDLGITVLYHGNSTNSGVGYCDVDHGYVNMDYKIYINLVLHEVSVCEKLDNYKNKCEAGQRLLPDSECVPVCGQGYEADKEDFFKCSLKSTIDTVITQPSTQLPDISTKPKIPTPKHITTVTKTTTVQEKGGENYTVIIAIVATVLGVPLTALSIYFLVKWCRRDKKSKTKEIKCKTAYDRSTIYNVKGKRDVHIHVHGEGEIFDTNVPSHEELDGEDISFDEQWQGDADFQLSAQSLLESNGSSQGQDRNETEV